LASSLYPDVLTPVCRHPHSVPCPRPYVPINPAFDNRVAFPETRRTTRQLTYSHGVKLGGFGDPQTALQDCTGFPSTITGLHPMTSPLALWTILCGQPWLATAFHPEWRRSLGPYVRRSYRLLLFLPGPQPVARSGRNPQRHLGLGWLLDLAIHQIHMPSAPP